MVWHNHVWLRFVVVALTSLCSSGSVPAGVLASQSGSVYGPSGILAFGKCLM